MLATLTLWLQHADALKAQSALGRQITSDALSTWNYGTLQQRLDPATWWGTVFKKRFSGAIGSNWIFLIFVIAGLWQKRTRAAVGILLLAYLAPFLVFTNLHIAHPYYQAANIVFATSIIGLVLWSTVVLAADSGGQAAPRRRAGDRPCACCRWASALVKSLKDIREAREPTAVSQIAEAIRTGTTAQGVVVAFGQDWSSELPYFSGRRAVMIPDWGVGRGARVAGRRRLAALGGLPLAALVNCP